MLSVYCLSYLVIVELSVSMSILVSIFVSIFIFCELFIFNLMLIRKRIPRLTERFVHRDT